MTRGWYRGLFFVAALYDGLLGAVFIFVWPQLFAFFGVTPPNHPGYVQFPAALLVIFAAMFFRIARDPLGNRDLILYGMALKVAYSGTVFWHALSAGIPMMWIPFAWIDVIFLAAFVVVWRGLAAGPRRAGMSHARA